MATRVIDDTKLQNIAVAIQSKDSGGQMTVDEMPDRIQAIPSSSEFDMTVTNNQIKMLVYIHPEIMHCCVNYVQTVANGVEVDWGDGSTIDSSTSTGHERFDCANIFHTYAETGLKIITLTAKQGEITVISANGFISFAGAKGEVNGNQFPNNYYRGALIGITFGNDTLGDVNECVALAFIINIKGHAAGSTSLTNVTINNSAIVCPILSSTKIRDIKIPVAIRTFYINTFRNCTYLGVVDFTDFSISELSQCTFDSDLFTGSTNNGLTILFKDRETAEYAKAITNLSVWADYIKYVGEV